MAAKKVDVAVVGHFSLDSIFLPKMDKPCNILGGAVAYVSLIARKLEASACVVSKVGGDFPESYFSQLKNAGVETSGIIKEHSEKTTSFELVYDDDLSSRHLRIRRQGPPITVNDLPKTLDAKSIHVAPIASEVSYELVEHLRGHCDYLSIDPQGLTRRFDSQGNVTDNANIDKRILSFVDVFKSSLDEIQTLTGKDYPKEAIKAIHDLGPKIAIVTLGADGSMLSEKGKTTKIPVCRPAQVVDPTGAGDVFIGAFMTEYVRKQEPFWCSCVGSSAASLVVEGIGTSYFGEKAEIYRRANEVYEKEIKP